MRSLIWRLRLLLIVVCVAQGCRYGQSVEEFPPAHLPNGAMVRVVTDQREIGGELIEVRDIGLVILADGQLQSLPYNSIRSIRIEATGHDFETDSQPFDSRRQQEVRLLSRYPQGLSPEVLEQLLAFYGQTELGSEGP